MEWFWLRIGAEILLDQLSLRELTLFEKGDLTELKETRVEEEEDGGESLKAAKEETVAVAEANAMLRVCLWFL